MLMARRSSTKARALKRAPDIIWHRMLRGTTLKQHHLHTHTRTQALTPSQSSYATTQVKKQKQRALCASAIFQFPPLHVRWNMRRCVVGCRYHRVPQERQE